MHPLTDEAYCVGYDPNKLLFCIGKCDIILGDGNLSNLCYFPISYEPDFDGIVNTAEQLCGGRKPELVDLYVYRLKKWYSYFCFFNISLKIVPLELGTKIIDYISWSHVCKFLANVLFLIECFWWLYIVCEVQDFLLKGKHEMSFDKETVYQSFL